MAKSNSKESVSPDQAKAQAEDRLRAKSSEPRGDPNAPWNSNPPYQVPSVLPLIQGVSVLDEEAAAFINEAGTDRVEPLGVPLVRIDHKHGLFVLGSRRDGVPLGATIEGYPFWYFQTRAWYAGPFQPGSHNLPDCMSADLLRPIAGCNMPQNEICATCRQNQYGTSSNGKGKACGSPMFLFLLNPEFGAPPVRVIELPTSSAIVMLGGERGFGMGYLSRAKFHKTANGRTAGVFERVWTRLNLEATEGVHYVVRPESLHVATGEEMAALTRLYKDVVAAGKRMQARAPEVVGGETEGF